MDGAKILGWAPIIALIAPIIALIGVVVLASNGINANIDTLRIEAAADRSEAAADRRANQTAMDTFREEMLALAQRQARLEGQLFTNHQ